MNANKECNNIEVNLKSYNVGLSGYDCKFLKVCTNNAMLLMHKVSLLMQAFYP